MVMLMMMQTAVKSVQQHKHTWACNLPPFLQNWMFVSLPFLFFFFFLLCLSLAQEPWKHFSES
jgi:hypothetical protein